MQPNRGTRGLTLRCVLEMLHYHKLRAVQFTMVNVYVARAQESENQTIIFFVFHPSQAHLFHSQKLTMSGKKSCNRAAKPALSNL